MPAVEQVQVAVGVEAADVAGVQPAIGLLGLGARLGTTPVAVHGVRAAGQDLAHLVDLQRAALAVPDVDLDERVRLSRRGQPLGCVLPRLQAGDRERSLGLPVELGEHRTEQVDPALQHGRRDRGAAVAEPFEREVRRRGRGLFEQHRDHRRDHERRRGAVLLSGLQEGGRGELRHDHLRRALHQVREEERAAAVGDRGRVQHHRVRAQVRQQVDQEVRHLGKLAAGGQHHRLRLAGGASGVGEPQRRVLVATDVARAGHRRPDQVRQLGGRDHVLDLGRRVAVVDQPAGLGVVDLVGVLVRGLTGVERYADQARLGQRVVGDDAVDPVGHQHRDPVACLETAGQEGMSEPVGQVVDVRERQHPLAVDEGGRGAELAACPTDQIPDLHCLSSPYPSRAREVRARDDWIQFPGRSARRRPAPRPCRVREPRWVSV